MDECGDIMRITQEGDYALRVVLFLYKYSNGERVEAKVISERENIPLRFLLKLLRKLASADIVKSYRGTGGGYAIEKPPSQVSILQVVQAIEGPIYVNKCLFDENMCNLKRAETCEIHKALENFQSGMLQGLDKFTFEEILKTPVEI
jgi:Rrf2 family iron-sulfur cluster assembly transcriptional regulator